MEKKTNCPESQNHIQYPECNLQEVPPQYIDAPLQHYRFQRLHQMSSLHCTLLHLADQLDYSLPKQYNLNSSSNHRQGQYQNSTLLRATRRDKLPLLYQQHKQKNANFHKQCFQQSLDQPATSLVEVQDFQMEQMLGLRLVQVEHHAWNLNLSPLHRIIIVGVIPTLWERQLILKEEVSMGMIIKRQEGMTRVTVFIS